MLLTNNPANCLAHFSLVAFCFWFTADCGDHVVCINTGKIAMPGDEWLKRVYFEHTGFAGGGSWTLAYELHEKDRTKVKHSNSCNFPMNSTSNLYFRNNADHVVRSLWCNENKPAATIHNVSLAFNPWFKYTRGDTGKHKQPAETSTSHTKTYRSIRRRDD